jgi:1,4-dihydroxy-2-naphthoate octaprenyltransferase
MGLYWAKTTSMAAAIYPFFTMPLVRRLLTGVFVTEPSPAYNRFLAMAAAIHILFGCLLAFALCSRW